MEGWKEEGKGGMKRGIDRGKERSRQKEREEREELDTFSDSPYMSSTWWQIAGEEEEDRSLNALYTMPQASPSRSWISRVSTNCLHQDLLRE